MGIEGGGANSKANTARAGILAICSSNLFALIVGGIYEYLSLRGVINVKAAWLVLVFVWFIGVIAIIFSEIVWGRRLRHKFWIGFISAAVLAALLWGLDAGVSRLLGASALNPKPIERIPLPLPPIPKSLLKDPIRPKPLLFMRPHHVALAVPAKPLANSAPASEDAKLNDDLKAIVEEHNCEQDRKGAISHLEDLEANATAIQLGFAGDNDAEREAKNFSLWDVQVRNVLRERPPLFDQGLSLYDGAHGNKWMKSPANHDPQGVALWQEIEAKKAVLDSYANDIRFNRCKAEILDDLKHGNF